MVEGAMIATAKSGVGLTMGRTGGEAARRPRVDQGESIDYQVTPSFVALLDELGCSLAISNYQSGAVMCFSSLGDGRPVQMYARFPAAMGLALDGDRLAVATR